MSSPVFDTLKAANSLKAVGFDDRQAEPMVTKEYLERYLKQYLDKRLEPMATRSDLQLIQHQVTTRLGALVVACVGVLGVLIGLF